MKTTALHAVALATLLCLAVSGCGAPPQAVTVKGSDTMVPLGQRWAEIYMKEHPSTTIQVTGGGSGTGIAALINGTTQICESSRPMKPEEKNSVKEQRKADVSEIPVALDALGMGDAGRPVPSDGRRGLAADAPPVLHRQCLGAP